MPLKPDNDHRLFYAFLPIVAVFILFPFSLFAQAPNISYGLGAKTYALGAAIAPFSPVNTGGQVPATIFGQVTTLVNGGAGFNFPFGEAIDSKGNLYVADQGNSVIRKITPAGMVSTFVSSTTGLYGPGGLAIDAQDNLYVANEGNNVILKVTPTGVVSTYAGSGSYGEVNGVALSASFKSPEGLVFDTQGDLYVSDVNGSVIRKITADGTVTTIAGTGTQGNNNGYAGMATFGFPSGLVIDAAGNLYVADGLNNEVRKITPTGVVSTFAGNGSAGVNNGPGNTANLNNPRLLAIDNLGNIYVADSGNNLIRKITPSGIVSTFAGSGTPALADGTGTKASFSFPSGITMDKQGTMYISDGLNNAVRKVPTTGYSITPNLPAGLNFDATSGTINNTPTALSSSTNYSVVAYNLFGSSLATINIKVTNGNPSANANLSSLIIDNGTLSPSFNVGTNSYTVSVPITVTSVTLKPTVADTAARVKINGAVVLSGFASPAINLNSGPNIITAVVTAPDGATINTYTVAVTRVTPAPAINYPGPAVYTAGTAITPLIPTSSNVLAPNYNSSPIVFASGLSGMIGLAVDGAKNVYVASNDGTVKKIPAGGGTPVTLGTFNTLTGIAADGAGNVYVAATSDSTIKKIPAGGGAVVDIGSGLASPSGVAVDIAGNIYVSESTIAEVTSIAAGNSHLANVGSLFFGRPGSLVADANGNVLVADQLQNNIFKIPAGGGVGKTLATGFNLIAGVAVDAAGNLYIADQDNNAIKKVPTGGGNPVIVSTGFSYPSGIAIDGDGNIYVADAGNNAIKEIKPTGGYFISPLLPAGLKFDSNTGIISGNPVSGSQAANYTVTAYNSFGSGTATLNISVNLPPLPAINYGFAKFYTVNKPIKAIAPVNIGVAAPAYGKPSVVGSVLLKNPSALAIDAIGNLYVTEPNTGLIKKIPADGGSAVVFATDFIPLAIAVDFAGNIYVADYSGSIKKFPYTGGGPISIGTGLGAPGGIAVDAVGNIYISEVSNNVVKKIPAGSNVPVVVASGFNFPQGLAIDAAGNIYVADGINYAIKKMPPGGGAPVTIATGFGFPTGIAIDAVGNIFVADSENNSIDEIAANNGPTIVLNSGFGFPGGIAIDGSHNIYFTDGGNTALGVIKPIGGYFVTPTLPAGLNFDSATGIISGTPTALSPPTSYAVTGYNISGGTKAYAGIEVHADASLDTLIVKGGILGPAFTSNFNYYTVSLADTSQYIKVTAIPVTANAVVQINGTTVSTAPTWVYTPLGVAPDTVRVMVDVIGPQLQQSVDGYTLVVLHDSFNATLANLVVDPSTVNLDFAPTITSYAASVSNAVTAIKLRPTANSAKATIKVNGVSVTSGSSSASIALNVGANTINTVVTAPDGITTVTYTVTVTRLPNNNANLNNIAISSGILSPSFVTSTVGYTASVTNATTSITLTPTTSDVNATVQVNGVAVASGTASASIPLGQGANSIHAVVHAQDGTQKTYTVTVTRLPNNANLSNLTISGGTLSPAFVSSTAGYTATVTNATTSTTVTPTTSDTKATVTVNGVAATSGIASTSILLNGGANTIYVVVLAQDGTRRTYTLTITKPLSNNANLANLAISSGTLAPVFVSSTVGYTATVGAATTSIQLTPTTSDVNATVQVNSITIKSGTASAGVPLGIGVNSVHAVVRAQDGTQRTYTITVTRLSNNANMASLSVSSGKLSPAFVPSTASYKDTVSNATASIQITPTTSDSHATVTVNGTAVTSGSASAAIPLVVGNNTIYAVVLAQDGTRKTYTITVRRLTTGGLNSLYLPGSSGQTPLVSSLNKKIEANNILSPNGDGINDVWVVKNIAFYPNNIVTVYNRAGEVVFTKKGYTNDWTGTYRGSVLNEGSYHYTIDLGDGSTVKGFITVVRDR